MIIGYVLRKEDNFRDLFTFVLLKVKLFSTTYTSLPSGALTSMVWLMSEHESTVKKTRPLLYSFYLMRG